VLALLGVSITASIASALALFNRLRLLDRMENGTWTFDEADRADDLVTATVGFLAIAAVTTGILWVIWQWRIAKNLQAFSVLPTRFTPGWSLGGWLIPCASLVIPVLVMQDLWRASEPVSATGFSAKRQGSALIGFWWAAFVVAALGSRLANYDTDTDITLDSVRSSDRLALGWMVVAIVAAILAMFVVIQLTDRVETFRAQIPPSRPATSVMSPADYRPPVAPPLLPTLSVTPAGWYSDPAGRFDHRYWDGAKWTEHVSRAGAASVDPLDASLAYGLQAPRSN
jgi:hypothetical protein